MSEHQKRNVELVLIENTEYTSVNELEKHELLSIHILGAVG